MQEEVAGYLVYSTLKHHGGSPVYLATPYTALAKDGQADRAAGFASQCAEKIYRQYGILALSPILYGHLFAVDKAEREDPTQWVRLCRQMFNVCRSVVVPKTPVGWLHRWSREASEGIRQEKEWAEQQVKPVMWLADPL